MLFWLVLTPILIALFLYIFPYEKVGRFIAITAQIALFGCSFYIFLMCKENDIVTRIGKYDGVLGITLKADTFSSVFIMLVSFIFLVAAVYNFNERYNKLFWFLMFIWQSFLIGIFLTRDLFNIFVLVEVATVVVAILIMFNRDDRSMHDGLIYLMVNTVAIQFYLFGIGYIYKLTGTLDMDAAILAIKNLDKSSLILPYALIMTSVSLKCALLPLFSWLPKAHGTPGAPSSVSAILSGLHIKSGVFLFIRFQDFFSDAINLSDFFLVTGIITGIGGFVFALSQSDIKLILAYHTISQIGMIMIGLSIDNIYSYTGGIYHIANHAFFKTALFLTAGIIMKIYGTRDLYKIKGVLRRTPVIGGAILMAIFGITGAPFFNGSISKYFITSGVDPLLNSIIILINLGTVISFIKYSTMLFGHPESDHEVIKIDGCKQAAILILGFFCLAGGIFGEQFVEFLFNIKLNVDTADYLQKAGMFALSGIAGFLIYRYYVRKSTLLKRIREMELNFRGICVSIGVFFAVMLIAARVLG